MDEEPFNSDAAAEPTAETEGTGGVQGKIKQAADDLKHAATAKASDLKAKASAKADDLRAAASSKADELRSVASAKADEWRGMANAKAEEFRGKAEEAWGEARVQARSYQEDGEAYVRENPLRAVALGVAAGFVLGTFLRK